jgi:signal transduction histidine kinase
MRTPLTTVTLGVELVISELRKLSPQPQLLSKRIQESISLLDNIGEATDITIAILNDLLQYDKIKTGSLQLLIACISPWDLVTSTTETFDIQARKQEIKLVLCSSGLHRPRRYGEASEATGDDELRSFTQGTMASGPSLRRLSGSRVNCSDDFPPPTKEFLESIVLVGDEMKLRQVVRNLLSNALKFTPVHGRVSISGQIAVTLYL